MKSLAKLGGKIGSDNSRKNNFKAPVKTWTSSSASKATYFSEILMLDELYALTKIFPLEYLAM